VAASFVVEAGTKATPTSVNAFAASRGPGRPCQVRAAVAADEACRREAGGDRALAARHQAHEGLRAGRKTVPFCSQAVGKA